MIGLLQDPSPQKSECRLTGRQRRSFVWALLAVACMSSQLWGQFNPQDLQDQFLGQNRFEEEEEPEEKPTLAERLNITPNPLMTLEEEKKLKIRQREYTSALRSPNPRATEERIIRDGVKARVYRLTIPENWDNIANLRRDLVNDIDSDRFAGDSHLRTRAIALDAAVNYLTELLSDQPEFVKRNALLLLGQLNDRSANLHDRIPSRPYAAAAEPLIQTIQSSDQKIPVKVTALIGLRRILKDSNPTRALRYRAAQVLVDELQATAGTNLPEGLVWYRWRIIDVLGMIRESRNAIQQPLVVDALWETMLDETMPWHIRTQAARSLSQLNLDGTFNLGLLAHEIVQLCGQMTVTYNSKPNLPYWRLCFMNLYFAFNPNSKTELAEGWGLLKQVESASLRSHEKLVSGAYSQVLKMVNGVMAHDPGRPVPNNPTLKEASEWLKSNPPTDQKLHSEAKTVEAIQKAHAPKDDANTAVSQNAGLNNGD